MLAPGSIILPGNMGRIMKLYKPNSDRLLQEEIYERARQKLQPEAPSRLSCTFVCPTVSDAEAFHKTESVKLNQWYFVEPIDPPKEVFVADFRNWAQPKPLMRPFNDVNFASVCNDYWTGGASSHRELLYGGALKVVGLAV